MLGKPWLVSELTGTNNRHSICGFLSYEECICWGLETAARAGEEARDCLMCLACREPGPIHSVLVTEDEAMNRKERFSVFIVVLAGRRKIFKNHSDKTYKESGTRWFGLKKKDEHLILREHGISEILNINCSKNFPIASWIAGTISNTHKSQ